MGQSAVDGLQMNRNDLRGTARFMSMGGAFTALGGDLSTLTQNPGGIGIYRSNEIGVTMDIDIMSSKSETQGHTMTTDMTKVYCPNFGYIGTWRTGNEIMPFFNWGVSYGAPAALTVAIRDMWTSSAALLPTIWPHILQAKDLPPTNCHQAARHIIPMTTIILPG